MTASPQFPDDENGDVLREMYARGDDLSQPRMVDFCFAFPGRRQALAFAEIVDDVTLRFASRTMRNGTCGKP